MKESRQSQPSFQEIFADNENTNQTLCDMTATHITNAIKALALQQQKSSEQQIELLKLIVRLLQKQDEKIDELKFSNKVKKWKNQASDTVDHLREEASKAAKKIKESKYLYGTTQDPGYLQKMIDAGSNFFSKAKIFFMKQAQKLPKNAAKIYHNIADRCQATYHMITKHSKELREIVAAKITTPLSKLHGNIKKAELDAFKRYYTNSGGEIPYETHNTAKTNIDQAIVKKKDLQNKKSKQFAETYHNKLKELRELRDKRKREKAQKKLEKEKLRKEYLKEHDNRKDAEYYKLYGALDPISTKIKRVIGNKLKSTKQYFQNFVNRKKNTNKNRDSPIKK